ncbi:MAG: ABC transporter ATP-binding protein [Myxococcaceae bacterium]|nr:ABC transporter ATP-binding protein [Myxococcaceae bacterium]
MLRLEAVSCTFPAAAKRVIDGLNLHVHEGEILALLGESGSGKTTTLKLFNRLVEPSAGRVFVEEEDVTAVDAVALRRRIGYAIQQVGLFPHFSVAENIGVVPRLLGWQADAIRARVDELLALMNLPNDLGPRRPSTLSGGQAQRVGLARALAARPHVMLLDEPFGAVDPVTRETLQVEYRKLHDALGLTTVLVTHDVTEALLLADRLAVLHEGRLLGLGTAAELLAAPPHPQVERLLAMPRRQAEAVQRRLSGQRA